MQELPVGFLVTVTIGLGFEGIVGRIAVRACVIVIVILQHKLLTSPSLKSQARMISLQGAHGYPPYCAKLLYLNTVVMLYFDSRFE